MGSFGDKVKTYYCLVAFFNTLYFFNFLSSHQNIYSIKNRAELIFDLKQVNLKELISIYLVFGFSVGMIAIGIVKVYADLTLFPIIMMEVGVDPFYSLNIRVYPGI